MVSEQVRQPRSPLFPTFFMGGFECSTFVDRGGRRQDLIQITQHDHFLEEDYERVAALGLAVVREGVPWYRVDSAGSHDFRLVDSLINAGKRHGLTQIWDLFHYGFPDDLNPLSRDFVSRFADYCHAFARYLMERTGKAGTRFYTPVNEPSFFSWAGGEAGWWAPFMQERGYELKLWLARAAIAGVDAIRSVDPRARILSVDPVIHTIAPTDAPELAEDAARFNTSQWEAWDIIAGKERSEWGGSSEHLDIVGVSYYPFGQWEYGHNPNLALNDPRRKPLRNILREVADRYPGHPLVVAETGCRGELRPVWLRHVVDDVRAALNMGVDVQGICLYPLIDMPSWHDGEYILYGVWDLVREGDVLKRQAYLPYVQEILKQQRIMGAEIAGGNRW